ncbi:flagellar biosynthesis protein FlhB [Porcipelethomonas sp.]|uniref:flagellar biosynthesis protein FlhB n=1 Tax=Porcipelethomonas sp. TaxID=2981675 RepID=UPI003EF29E5D
MPDSSEEKTEKATPKKRTDQRKEGNIFQSKEVIIAVSLIITVFAFKLLYSTIEGSLKSAMKSFFALAGTQENLTSSDLTQIFIQGCIVFAKAALPLLLIAAAAAIIAGIAQTKMLVSFKAIKPKFSRMNPINGLKNMISMKGLVELLKSIIKIVILFYIIYSTLKNEVSVLPKMIDMSVAESVSTIGGILWKISYKIVIAYAFVAGFDYMYQRWEYEKNLKMTKQEVKEEYKMTEGDPKVKGQIKQKQQAMSRRRMMQAVPEANVVIRNPTHYAVALKYDPEKNKAPVVIAKGKDHMAFKIIEIAEQHNIVITENRPLARALYAEVDIDMEIPSEFYNPVAEVLAYVYSLKEKDLR